MPNANGPLAQPRKSALMVLALSAILLLGCQIYWVGPELVWSTLSSADKRWSVVATAAIVAAALIGCFNVWMLCIRREGIALTRFLRRYWVGWSVGLVLPGQVGDALTTSYLLREDDIPVRRSLSGLGLDKLVSLVVMLACACTTPLVVVGAPAAIVSIGFASLIALGFAAVLVLNKLVAIPAFVRERRAVILLADLIEHGAQLLRSYPGLVAVNCALTLVKLGATGFAYWCTIQAMGHDLQPVDLIAVTLCAVSAGLIAYIPVSLNGLGTVEFTGIMLFGLVSIDAATVLSAYLFLRFATLMVAFVPTAMIALLAVTRQR